MRFNKVSLFSSLFVVWVAIANCELINEPNPRLGFPQRNQSVANALYSAIELHLSVVPPEQIQEEIDTMKKKIRIQSREQYQRLHPDAEFNYKIQKKNK
ncbi:Protein CBG27142 [Caenorhabditis briggsae]|uniref:Uncharacterized protein n=2 Tax=Caenorhabditis briggsae TaxID=6238 RepID=A0AAE9JMB8_CAEBR|nr:Protein CBG27142 [Caenorhabditis briggsae]ULT90290.1 hypothetical protein L3Y34_008563 [Caenorhabditis briggsae]UMM36085.1 hypothetical protein L5515_008405 [Caenorhabditis briggsae]CAS00605.1 Protein CBG27142 [Caenorhabditis briggsae]